MEIVVHFPGTKAQEAELHQLAAKVHAQYAAVCAEGLPCPLEQKLQLMDAAADAILTRSRTGGSNPKQRSG